MELTGDFPIRRPTAADRTTARAVALWIIIALLALSALMLSGCGHPPLDTTGETTVVDAASAVAVQSPGPVAANPTSAPSAEGIFLPNQWTLRPAGQSIPLGDFPVDMAVSPDGRTAAVMQCGYGAHEVRLISLPDRREIARTTEPRLWHGCAFSPDGKHLFVSAGADDAILRYSITEQGFSERVQIPIRQKEGRSWYVSGVAVDPNGTFALVAGQFGNRLVQIDGIAATPEAKVLVEFKEGDVFPYEVVIHPLGTKAYVSLWAGKAVAEVSLPGGETRLIATDAHPCEMALTRDGERLFVTCANTNKVNVIDTKSGRVTERLSVSLYPSMPAGSTPNALALNADETRLYVANADNNAVAVFDVSKDGATRPLGFIPTGWYPTALTAVADDTLVVVNAKGNGSLANPYGPNPYGTLRDNRAHEYIGGLLLGSMSFIQVPDRAELAEYTRQAYLCSPLRPDLLPVGRESGNPIPARVGDPSPIKHCFYIIKENRTYDQVLGDMPEGNGDPEICLFPESVSPNHHAIAREFVLLDNFYVESEVSADGHEWSMGAYATDFVEKGWPADYGGHADYGYVAEGFYRAADPEAGHLWDRAKEAGITYYTYGEWMGGAGPDCKGVPKAKALEGHCNPCFREFDMNYSDLERAKVFLAEFKEFVAKGEFPQLTILHLPNDHTAGSSMGSLTPRAFVAENDLALGQILEALSNSPFWKEMAVFVVEDDAQNGPDHVDAHRTIAFLAGPYVKRNHVDHTMYSTASVLRTIELILGLQPMSQFDAAARPLYASFTATPDTTPYHCKPATYPLTERNGDDAPMQKESSQMNFEKEDSNPDVLFNEIIWKTVKGADSEMPAPVRAAFIRPIQEAGEEREVD